MKGRIRVAALIVMFAGAHSLGADAATKPKISQEQAQTMALKAVPGDLRRWDLENEDEGPVYHFDIKQRNLRIMSVEVNGTNGKLEQDEFVIQHGDARGVQKTKNAEDLAKLKSAKITKDQAQANALKKFAGTVEQWEAKMDDGKLVYEFLIAGKAQKNVVAVDAKSGRITETSTFVAGDGI